MKTKRETCYRVRDSETGKVLSLPYRKAGKAAKRMIELEFRGRPMEVYRGSCKAGESI